MKMIWTITISLSDDGRETLEVGPFASKELAEAAYIAWDRKYPPHLHMALADRNAMAEANTKGTMLFENAIEFVAESPEGERFASMLTKDEHTRAFRRRALKKLSDEEREALGL